MDYYVIAFIISLVLAVISAPIIVAKLRKMKFGQKILEIGPSWHMSKQYTPTMGGWIFVISTGAAVVATAIINGSFGVRNIDIILFAFALIFGIIGMVDDMTKIKKKQNAGLTPMQKLILQFAAAALFVSLLRYFGVISPVLYIPFVGISWDIPWLIYLLFSVFVIVATVNAVNLTDGIDGLATMVTIVVTAFFLFSYIRTGGEVPLAFASALLGGLIAFYLFNKYPARVFMGDTGALFLGGAVSAMAFAVNLPIVIVPIGIIYVAEAMSDIIQVGYFKMSGGKRIFKMAPLHHHFEMCGWSEKKIVFIFSSITITMCVLTYFLG